MLEPDEQLGTCCTASNADTRSKSSIACTNAAASWKERLAHRSRTTWDLRCASRWGTKTTGTGWPGHRATDPGHAKPGSGAGRTMGQHPNYTSAWHGTQVEAIWAIFYHGQLKPSDDEEQGGKCTSSRGSTVLTTYTSPKQPDTDDYPRFRTTGSTTKSSSSW